MKKVTCSFARDFVCGRCPDVKDGTKKPEEVLCDEMETANGFCYLGDRLNASGGCETAVTPRVRIGCRTNTKGGLWGSRPPNRYAWLPQTTSLLF